MCVNDYMLCMCEELSAVYSGLMAVYYIQAWNCVDRGELKEYAVIDRWLQFVWMDRGIIMCVLCVGVERYVLWL